MSRELKTAASFGPTPLMNCTGVSSGATGAERVLLVLDLEVLDFDDGVEDPSFGCVDFNFVPFFFTNERASQW